MLGSQIKPLLNSSLVPPSLRKKINANVQLLTNQINALLTSAAGTLAQTYASSKLGGADSAKANTAHGLLSKLSLVLLTARIGLARLCLIVLTLSSMSVLASNDSLLRRMEGIERMVFAQPMFSRILRQCPKTMAQIDELARIYWDVSAKVVRALAAIFAAVVSPKDSLRR